MPASSVQLLPKVMEILGYIIYFWSNEGRPSEPLHVHVARRPTKNGTKIWINRDGSTELEHNKGQIPPKDLRRLMKIIAEYHLDIEHEWKRHFKADTVTYKNEVSKAE